jgi:hypothetical protein
MHEGRKVLLLGRYLFAHRGDARVEALLLCNCHRTTHGLAMLRSMLYVVRQCVDATDSWARGCSVTAARNADTPKVASCMS